MAMLERLRLGTCRLSRLLLPLATVCLFCAEARSTTSSGLYSVPVGRYQLVSDGATTHAVYVTDAAGRNLTAKLIEYSEATGIPGHLSDPPRYLVLPNYLVLEYDHLKSAKDMLGEHPRCFAIRHDDYAVTGPLSMPELERLLRRDLSGEAWETVPVSKGISFWDVFLLLLLYFGAPFLLLTLIVFGLVKCVRSWIRRRKRVAAT
ncbi:MAG: hypothetical protein KDA91_25545 [Planctomycetaceae bacterium]|nr:hypothetical protein [Planctomycetaceae bacterium]